MNMWNRHRESQNTRNTWQLSFDSGTKLFIYLSEFKVFQHEERETQFLTMLTVRTSSALDSLNQQTCGTFRRPQLVSPRRASKIDVLRPSPNLNSLFFQVPKSSAHRFRAWRHSRPRSHLLLWHMWLSHPPRARVNTCSQCVHITNPCTKPKGSQHN